jgi:hypothetical protein
MKKTMIAMGVAVATMFGGAAFAGSHEDGLMIFINSEAEAKLEAHGSGVKFITYAATNKENAEHAAEATKALQSHGSNYGNLVVNTSRVAAGAQFAAETAQASADTNTEARCNNNIASRSVLLDGGVSETDKASIMSDLKCDSVTAVAHQINRMANWHSETDPVTGKVQWVHNTRAQVRASRIGPVHVGQ